MADFDFKILSIDDGSWDAFCTNWKAQCEEVEEQFDDYAADAFQVIHGIMSGTTVVPEGAGTTVVGALWDAETKHFYAVCVLHRALLPAHPGFTLRVRQLIVCPLLDYGLSPVQMYPDVVVGVMVGIVHVSSTVLRANNIHFHLRSPEDMSFFRTFGVTLDETKVFASVQMRGSWLYIEKIGAVSASAEETEA